ncbi:MAG TPA: pyrroline-5-carboxylate reductase [Dongiaceae bacterium]|nr:pyrroline-5-carboxylate reductase [Dongiaceae bacterium]
MRLGFVGTGAITSAIVTGLNAAGGGDTILVSPRNAATAAALAAKHPNVTIAASNQAVLDGSDVVMLAVRPQVATEVLSELKFRADHHIISLMAIIPLEEVRAMVAPARTVTRTVPLPLVADRCGPTPIFPPDQVAAGIFNRIGTAIEATSADQFSAYCSATATMASYFTFAEEIAAWLMRHGVPSIDARRYVGTVFQGLGNIAATTQEHGLAALAAEFATRGGINEQVLAHMKARGAFDALSEGLDAVLQRMKNAN